MARQVTIWAVWDKDAGVWAADDGYVNLFPTKNSAEHFADHNYDEVVRPYCKGVLCPTPKHKRAARVRA